MTSDRQNDTKEYIDIAVTGLSIQTSYILIAVIGVVGNTLVASVMLGVRKLRIKLTNIYIINQSVLDCLTALLLLLTTLIRPGGSPLTGISGQLMCFFWIGKTPLWACMFSSTYNLVALTVERYCIVVHPIRHRMSTKTTAIWTLVLIWLSGPVLYVSYTVSTSSVHGGKCNLLMIWPNGTTQQMVGVVAVILQYFVPVTIMVFCYSRMAYELAAIRNRVHAVEMLPSATDGLPTVSNGLEIPGASSAAQGPSRHTSRPQHGRQIIKTLAIVSSAFIVCTSCNQWFFFLFNIGSVQHEAFGNTFYHFSVVMMFCNCCVNPIIYVFKYNQFQVESKKIFRKLIGRDTPHIP